MITRSRKAFTLLELMVAFIIMAILSAIAVPSLLGIVNGDTATANQTSAIAAADASYYLAASGANAGVVNYTENANGSAVGLEGTAVTSLVNPALDVVTYDFTAGNVTVCGPINADGSTPVLQKDGNC